MTDREPEGSVSGEREKNGEQKLTEYSADDSSVVVFTVCDGLL